MLEHSASNCSKPCVKCFQCMSNYNRVVIACSCLLCKYYRLRITERNADVSLLSAIYVNISYAGCMIDLNIRWPFTVLQTAIETITKKRFELVSKSLAHSSFDEVATFHRLTCHNPYRELKLRGLESIRTINVPSLD